MNCPFNENLTKGFDESQIQYEQRLLNVLLWYKSQSNHYKDLLDQCQSLLEEYVRCRARICSA